MRLPNKIRVTVISAMVLTGACSALVTAQPAAASTCTTNAICFWQNTDYTGLTWNWYPTSGYRNMPSFLHDHAYSFKSAACAYGFDFHSDGTENIATFHIGDYGRNWAFGRKIDAVTTRPC